MRRSNRGQSTLVHVPAAFVGSPIEAPPLISVAEMDGAGREAAPPPLASRLAALDLADLPGGLASCLIDQEIISLGTGFNRSRHP
jgi:hypothetical protein